MGPLWLYMNLGGIGSQGKYMKKYIKHILVAVLLFLTFFLLVGFFLVQYLADELDTNFYAPTDSVPTKVYSKIFWLGTEQIISWEELQARLAEREYQKTMLTVPTQQMAPASYLIHETKAENQEMIRTIQIFAKAFLYPQIVKEKFFPAFPWDVNEASVFHLTWQAGKIMQLKRWKIPNYETRTSDTIVVPT